MAGDLYFAGYFPGSYLAGYFPSSSSVGVVDPTTLPQNRIASGGGFALDRSGEEFKIRLAGSIIQGHCYDIARSHDRVRAGVSRSVSVASVHAVAKTTNPLASSITLAETRRFSSRSSSINRASGIIEVGAHAVSHSSISTAVGQAVAIRLATPEIYLQSRIFKSRSTLYQYGAVKSSYSTSRQTTSAISEGLCGIRADYGNSHDAIKASSITQFTDEEVKMLTMIASRTFFKV